MRKLFYFVSIFLLIFSLVHSVSAQSGPGHCGTACPCGVGNICQNGTCFERGCNPARDAACCKSQRVIAPRTPTAPPVKNNPGGPGTIVATPGVIVAPSGSVVDPRTPSKGALTPMLTPPVGGGTAGDCSGPTEGTSDGKVDLIDFNLLRKEISVPVTSPKCDFEPNGVVDLLDFNTFRIAFVAQK